MNSPDIAESHIVTSYPELTSPEADETVQNSVSTPITNLPEAGHD